MNDQDIYSRLFGSGVGLSLAPRSNVNGATFSGDGVKKVFAFSSSEPIVSSNPNSYDIIIYGVGQIPTKDYSVDVGANSITFVEAPPAGTDNVYVRIIAQAVSETESTAVSINGYLTANPAATPVPRFAGIGGPFNDQAQALLNNLALTSGNVQVASYEGLRAYNGPASAVMVTGYLITAKPSGVFGLFVLDSGDTTSADNDGTIIVDAAGRRWKRQFDGVLMATWFGAKGDGVTDDTAAIQKMLTVAYYSAPQVSWRKQTAKCHLPKGTYRIAQANILFSGLAAFSFVLSGDGGEGITELVYDVAEPSASDYLFNNNNLFGFAQFKGIRFTCLNSGANQNFMKYHSTGTAQGLTFSDFRIENFTNLFDVGNIANASENTFFDGKLTGFSGYAFRFNNPQSVNWRFYGVDAESFTGKLFEYVKGAHVVWYQGSIIPVGGSAEVVSMPSSADVASFGPGNAPHLVMDAVRLELRTGAKLTNKQTSSAGLILVFRDSGMGGFNIPDPAVTKAIVWQGAGKIVFERCFNMQKYRMDHTAQGASAASELAVVVEDCDIPVDFITASTFTLSGGTSNIGRRPLFMITGCGRAVDGIYRPANSQVASPSISLSVSQQKRAITWSAESDTLIVTAGSTQTLALPPVKISQIDLYPTAFAGYTGITATIVVTNGDGTKTLGTFSYNMGTPSAKYSVDLNHFVDSMAGDTIKVVFSHSYTVGTALVFRGSLYFTY